MHFQACSLGLSEQFEEVKRMYIVANQLLGDLIKVHRGILVSCVFYPSYLPR
jgi:pyruvate carboxylase